MAFSCPSPILLFYPFLHTLISKILKPLWKAGNSEEFLEAGMSNQWFRSLVVLPEDLGLFPRTHITAHS